jgi:hypothetical protein
MVEVEEIEQTAFLRHYMKCKIVVVRYMSKICDFAIKTIEVCPKTEKRKLKICNYMQNKSIPL